MAVAIREKGKYRLRFPKTNNKEDIMAYLDQTGFTMVNNVSPKYSSGALKAIMADILREYHRTTGEPCYGLGTYSTDKHTHWIRICLDGHAVYLIRTDDVTGSLNTKGNYFRETSIGECIQTFDELRNELEKQIELALGNDTSF